MGLLDLIRRGGYVADAATAPGPREGRSLSLAEVASRLRRPAVYEVAGELADEWGLPDGWLNDAVKGFLAGADPDAPLVLEVTGLHLSARFFVEQLYES